MNGHKIYLMKYLSLFCLVLLGLLLHAVLPLQAAEWGNLSGQFIYTGNPPNPKTVKLTKDQSLVIGKNGGLKNIFIFLKKKKSQEINIHPSYYQLPKKVSLFHQNSIYEPHILGLWHKHQELVVINKDPHDHIVHIHARKNYFPGTLPKKIIKQRTFRFQTSEIYPIPVKCIIHPWETAYLLVLDHPYFSSTDETGAFTIKNLPVGDFQFRIWHEKVGHLLAKEEWERGRIKIKIKTGKNDLGVIKVSPKLFEKK